MSKKKAATEPTVTRHVVVTYVDISSDGSAAVTFDKFPDVRLAHKDGTVALKDIGTFLRHKLMPDGAAN